MTMYPRGSEWRRWDLHVHSPLSILANEFPYTQGVPDWNTYVSALEAQPIAVYGITDYFTIEGYKHLKELQSQGRLAGKRLFPNIEFRLDRLINARGAGQAARRLNFHVIFSDDVVPSAIEDHFLHDLNFVYENNPADAAKTKRLKPSNLQELGEQLKSEDASFTASALQVGAMTAIVHLEDILEVLQANDRFKDKYIVALPAEHWDQITWGGGDHLVRKTLLQAAHLVLAANPRTIEWCLGRSPYEQGAPAFIREFGALKACIHGSDAHKISGIGHPCAKRSDPAHDCERDRAQCELRNCWVKADPTFEGLRQVLYEPGDRVRIQTSDPTPSKSIHSLDHLTIPRISPNAELTIAETDIPLNQGLIAVTGGKGSGKTAFVDLLAAAFMDRENADDRNSFVRRIAGEPQKVRFVLRLTSSRTFDKTIGDAQRIDDSQVAYIAQGELERYIDENSDLNRYVHRLIFSSGAIKDTVDAFDYDSLDSKVTSLEADLAAQNRTIGGLEHDTDPAVASAVTKAGKQAKAELDDIDKRIKILEADLSQDKIAANTAAQQAVAATKERRDQLLKARGHAEDVARSLLTDMRRLGDLIVALNAHITALGLGVPITTPSYPDVHGLGAIRSEIETRLKATVTEIERQELTIKRMAEEVREHGKALSKRQELQTKYTDLQEQWRTITAKKEQLEAARSRRTELLKTLLDTVLSQRAQYSKIITTFAQTKEPILNDLDFRTRVVVNEADLMATMESLVDNRQVEVVGTERAASEFSDLIGLLRRLADGENVVDAVAIESDRLAESLRGKLKARMLPEALYNALNISYLSVRPEVLFKNTALDRLSLGQKATVLMKIYLAEGEHPIIIDSHDDHLDNEYIMEELVGAIRHAKTHRQVIIASNNGNVVVNSDAEQLIVAQRQDGVVSYTSGALEDPDIRAKALKVLEGGADAFKKRQEKYRMA